MDLITSQHENDEIRTGEGETPVAANCCGLGPVADPSLRWNDHGHQKLIDEALELLAKDAVRSLPSVRLVRELFLKHAKLKEQLKVALKDADFQEPWLNPYLLPPDIAMFASHFFNPDTGKSLPVFSCGWSATAVSEGQRYFHLAVEAARRILRLGTAAPEPLYKQAGDYLGLALHFFTDLTQPMHAAGFANVVGDSECPVYNDRRHTAFENRADEYLKSTKIEFDSVNPVLVTDEELARVPSAAALFVDTARQAKKIWDGGLGTYTAEKPRTKAEWPSDVKVDGFIKAAFQPAAARVARLLAYFAFCARQDVERHGLGQSRWYELVEPTRHDVLASSPRDEYVRREHTPQPYRSLVAFFFDEDGRCALVPCNNRKHAWALVTPSLVSTTDYLRSIEANDERARFRVMTRPDGTLLLYSAARIRKPDGKNGNGDYAITVDRATGDAYGDYPPYGIAHPDAQPLLLRPQALLTAEELRDLRAKQPALKVDLPWWGTPGGNPQWRGTWGTSIPALTGGASALAMVSTGSGQLQLFAIFSDKLYRRDFLGVWDDAWQEVRHPDKQLFAAPLAALAEGDRIHVFARGKGDATNRLHHGTFTAGKWHWGSIAANIKYLAACSTAPGRIDLMATDNEKRLWTRGFDGAAWGDWALVTPGGQQYEKPISAVSFRRGRTDVVDRSGNAIRLSTSTGGPFTTKFLTPPITADRALVTSWENRLVVIAIQSPGEVALCFGDGDNWSSWQQGVRNTSNIGEHACVASWGPYRADVIVTDSIGNLCPRAYC